MQIFGFATQLFAQELFVGEILKHPVPGTIGKRPVLECIAICIGLSHRRAAALYEIIIHYHNHSTTKDTGIEAIDKMIEFIYFYMAPDKSRKKTFVFSDI